jgi:hypothetical protein
MTTAHTRIRKRKRKKKKGRERMGINAKRASPMKISLSFSRVTLIKCT